MTYLNMKKPQMRTGLPLLLAATLLTACHSESHDDDSKHDSENRTFSITVTNLTANQPLSPLAAVAHTAGYHAFVDGEAASTALEVMAEGGDNGALLTEAEAASQHLDSKSGAAPIGPGASDTLELSVTQGSQAHLSLLSMLVNTNDAFTASDAYSISDLALNESRTINLPVWDAGTEANSEAAGTIPGPADQGEGYNAARDDIVNFVGIHRGVISADDGLATSVLNESHRFLNPAAKVTIKRID